MAMGSRMMIQGRTALARTRPVASDRIIDILKKSKDTGTIAPIILDWRIQNMIIALSLVNDPNRKHDNQRAKDSVITRKYRFCLRPGFMKNTNTPSNRFAHMATREQI
jgi:diketogulonate reductase-like aldo/keto reductase